MKTSTKTTMICMAILLACIECLLSMILLCIVALALSITLELVPTINMMAMYKQNIALSYNMIVYMLPILTIINFYMCKGMFKRSIS